MYYKTPNKTCLSVCLSNTGRLHAEVQRLTLLNTIVAEKVLLLYILSQKKVPISGGASPYRLVIGRTSRGSRTC